MGRTTSGLGYGQRQLFRRPAPTMEVAPYPTFRGRQGGFHNQVFPDDNQQVVEWDYWEFDDETIYEEEDFSGDYLTSIRVACPGLYLVNFTIGWDNTSSWDTTLIINTPYRNYVTTYGFTGNSFDDYYGCATLIDLWYFDPTANLIDPNNPPATVEMEFQCNQNSGVNQDAFQIDVLVVRLGLFDVTTPTCDIGSPWPPGRIIDGGCGS